MALSAVVFDVDGTLIDTNQAHVQAWAIALKKHGYMVSSDRLAVEIGKGGDKLIPSVLGHGIDKKDGKSLRKGHTEEYIKIAESTPLKCFTGVQRLLLDLKSRGVQLAIATSSSPKELEVTQKSAGADWSDLFDVVATSADASDSKPSPGILQAAVKKLKLSPATCVMIGDTPYDADTARDAGLISLGFTCGGMNDSTTLRATGMRATYRDPADMADHLDQALTIASPGTAFITEHLMMSLMKEALAVARRGMEHGEVPIGCVIARGDGTIIAAAHNELNASKNKTAHAEIVAFAKAAGKTSTDARDLILVSTLEPCVMCLGASMEAAVDTILFGLSAPTDGGRLRVRPPVSPESQMPRLVGNLLADESQKLLEEFLQRKPENPAQVKFVKDLLAK